MSIVTKKLFRHGGSQAINLPKEFTENLSGKEVIVEATADQVVIHGKGELDTLESDPLFATFIEAIAIDAMKHPEKLHDLNEVSAELDELLEGVSFDEDTDDE